MRVCAIAGGVGSARFCAGLYRILAPGELTIAVNTGDDERIRGLLVCPDIDTVLYHLAGATDWERGWGLASETFTADQRYRQLAERVPGEAMQEWFSLGDGDLATHLFRARLLDRGRRLGEITAVLTQAMGIAAGVMPVTEDELRTVIETASGERLAFQEYFVHRHQDEDVAAVSYQGAETARPAPGVLEAISSAPIVVIPPSNPILSVLPALAVPGVRDALAAAGGRRVGVSPIVGGRALKGPADRILASLGHEVSPVGVARLYSGLLDVFVLDATDRAYSPGIEALGMRPVVCDTLMTGPEAAGRVAATVLEAVA